MIHYLIDLVYPKNCLGCGKSISNNVNHICLNCRSNLPISSSIDNPNNALEKSFWGRFEVKSAVYFLNFEKNNLAQQLVHQLKYKGHKELGITLGRICSSVWKDSKFFEGIDLILPVPIHLKKKRLRGYNQSEYFAKGISENLGIELNVDNLIKRFNTTSQTKKNRWERWKNVETSFDVTQKELLLNKNLLLVDDVVTTGSTLESCAKVLLECNIRSLKIITLAATL